ncbi:two-component system response regulator [Bacillus sp. T3]|uniref:response regulator n=1 Tax=Bacillus sp. T3 TaxID=467262 RepID=UPI003992EE94
MQIRKLPFRIILKCVLDCLILDNSLGNKLGYHFLDEIQKHNKKLFVPKIILSSDPSREARLKALSNGADDYFTKPLDIEEISIRNCETFGIKTDIRAICFNRRINSGF